jgi:hypothetical protein
MAPEISISIELLRKVGSFLGDSTWLDAVVMTAASRSIRLYARWNEGLERSALEDSEDGLYITPSDQPTWAGRQNELRQLWERVRRSVPHVYREICVTFGVPLVPLEKRRGRELYTHSGLGISAIRFKTAIYRVLLPLLEARDSGWVERRGSELDDREFEQFVEAGWKREKILLTRASDLQRAQRLRGLADFAAAAGGYLSPTAECSTRTRRK